VRWQLHNGSRIIELVRRDDLSWVVEGGGRGIAVRCWS